MIEDAIGIDESSALDVEDVPMSAVAVVTKHVSGAITVDVSP